MSLERLIFGYYDQLHALSISLDADAYFRVLDAIVTMLMESLSIGEIRDELYMNLCVLGVMEEAPAWVNRNPRAACGVKTIVAPRG
jgi:hypothetical protein